MDIEEAFRSSITYETRVRNLYLEAAAGTREAEARALYEILGRDEESHIDYLRQALERWMREGRIEPSGPATTLPLGDRLEAALLRASTPLAAAAAGADEGGERAALSKALTAEIETSAYYRFLADSLPPEAQGVFRRFAEIEDGHATIVRAQLDLVSRTGYWFDVREFDLED
ncbi:MAG TPA: ferritin family protein [Magnetospirillaceae bacterium]|nr:ferritin family protein [Magnetospirillaceae bacterium]